LRVREQKKRLTSIISRETFSNINKSQLIRLLIIAGAVITAIAVIASLAMRGNIESSFLAQAETVRVGIRTDIAGFGQVGESGEIEGFDADVAKEVVSRVLQTDKPVEFVGIASEDAGAAIKYDRVDIALGFLAQDTDRVSGFTLTDPYYTENVDAAVADPSISTLSALNGKKIGILNSAIPLATANGYLESLNITADIERYFSLDDAAFDLGAQKIDAFLAPESVLKQYLPSYTKISEPVAQIGYGILIPSSQNVVEAAMNDAIRSMQRDGTIESLAQKWGIPYEG